MIKNVVGDVLIASGVISYMGPFTADFRERIVRTWIDESCRRKVRVLITNYVSLITYH